MKRAHDTIDEQDTLTSRRELIYQNEGTGGETKWHKAR